MTNSIPHPKVDFFFEKTSTWQAAFQQLRTVMLDCGLTETLKWGCPCYTYGNKNIVLLHGFKAYCAVLFFKGALLGDPQNILVQQTENVQAARQIRFTTVAEIARLKKTLKAYIFEAIEIENAGLTVTLKKTADFTIPEEFQQKLQKSRSLQTAFDALTPGRQRAYLVYFLQAKQSKTRLARIEKYIPKIIAGKGLND